MMMMMMMMMIRIDQETFACKRQRNGYEDYGDDDDDENDIDTLIRTSA